MTRRGAAVLLAAALACPGVSRALPARPQGPVADLANILDAATREEIDGLIRQTQEKNGAVLVVATVPSLDGMEVEDYAVRLFKDWGIGDKDKKNGVLLLVAPAEHKVRIEVGYGLEGVLPDGRCGGIIRDDIVPAFRRSAPGEGVLAGAKAIVGAIGGEPAGSPEAHADEPDFTASLKPILGAFVAAIAIFIVGLAFGYTERGHSWAWIICLAALVPAAWGVYLAIAMLGRALVAIVILALTSGEHIGSGRITRTGRGYGGGWTSGGFGGWSGSGGGGGFGGFGGGSSGGGGASGSW